MFKVEVRLLAPRAIPGQKYDFAIWFGVASGDLLGQRVRLGADFRSIIRRRQRGSFSSGPVAGDDTGPVDSQNLGSTGSQTPRPVAVPFAVVEMRVPAPARHEDLQFANQLGDREVWQELYPAHTGQRSQETIQDL